uniref:Uncharacterized protein n=1 Tax=Eutreptiella gymnastica TaxID=73025 RepID=A0A6T2CMY3_9EUGL
MGEDACVLGSASRQVLQEHSGTPKTKEHAHVLASRRVVLQMPHWTPICIALIAQSPWKKNGHLWMRHTPSVQKVLGTSFTPCKKGNSAGQGYVSNRHIRPKSIVKMFTSIANPPSTPQISTAIETPG